MSRLLKISCTTIIKRIRAISASLKPHIQYKPKSIYEMDEMHTFIQLKSNDCWISYAIDRFSKRVIDFRLGGRTKSKLKPVIQSILYLLPKRIYTDGLTHYQNLIPRSRSRPRECELLWRPRRFENLKDTLPLAHVRAYKNLSQQTLFCDPYR